MNRFILTFIILMMASSLTLADTDTDTADTSPSNATNGVASTGASNAAGGGAVAGGAVAGGLSATGTILVATGFAVVFTAAGAEIHDAYKSSTPSNNTTATVKP